MATTITMPKLGLTMNSGSVQEWKKKVGDSVKKGEILYVVATDKLTVDVESPADGILLDITVQNGEDAPVGGTIGYIGEAGEKIEKTAALTHEATHEAQTSTPLHTAPGVVNRAPGERIIASPKAKKLARDSGVDLAGVRGTGPGGRIIARDVENAKIAGRRGEVKASPVAAKMAAEAGIDLASIETDGKRVMKADVQAVLGAGEKGATKRLPITQMRRIICERMLNSVTTIPSVNYFVDIDMTELNALRASYNERLSSKKSAVKISVNDILMKFCAKLLLEYPMANASVEVTDGAPSAYILHDNVNIGFAVALPGGLIVPNVKDVQIKSLTQIAAERAELVEKARAGGLTSVQISGGTFTISNLGMFGMGFFTPIINAPEAAILGVSATIDKPIVRDGSVVVRPMSTFCMTADHRLLDGADAAAFLARFKELVENTDLFLL
ncbi:dihydrolipoamide acetyltransferase component of pyruvate dehydrogenase complex [Synergistales bacterium]|nr:dihydrolipoamide acetyltransferase component of pyruvate dehydrogenase complex [Synergistales bacterium]